MPDATGERETIEVTVEIPQGQRNKYEIDHETGRLHLDRLLFTATRYPAEYGFIEGTLGRDGDPLDALVLAEEPTVPGCVITARPIGMFVMDDENGSDDKVLAVPAGDPRYAHLRDVDDIPEHTRLEIQHFFQVYKQLEPGKEVSGTTWAGRADAQAEIEEAVGRAGGRPAGEEAGEEAPARRAEIGPRLRTDGPRDGPVAAPHLVVGYRHDEAGRDALAVAADLAERLRAHVDVVHAVDLSDYPLDPDSGDWEARARETLDAERAAVAETFDEGSTSWTYHAAHGDPADLLDTVADEQDALFVVVGTRSGGGGLVARLLGERSVSRALLRDGARPVLVVPGRSDRDR